MVLTICCIVQGPQVKNIILDVLQCTLIILQSLEEWKLSCKARKKIGKKGITVLSSTSVEMLYVVGTIEGSTVITAQSAIYPDEEYFFITQVSF